MTINIEGFGKITASKKVLNEISLLALDASKYRRNKGQDSIANNWSDISDFIYDTLLKAKYYD